MTHVTFTTALPLTKTQLTSLKKAVEEKYGKEVEYTEKVDPSILGGVIVTMNSRQIDASLKTKLQQAKQMLIERIQNS